VADKEAKGLMPHLSLLFLHSTLWQVSVSLKNGLRFENFYRPAPPMHVASFPPLSLLTLFASYMNSLSTYDQTRSWKTT
jgi:hypothetical protein